MYVSEVLLLVVIVIVVVVVVVVVVVHYSDLVCTAVMSNDPVSQRSRVRIPLKPEFFSGFSFAIA